MTEVPKTLPTTSSQFSDPGTPLADRAKNNRIRDPCRKLPRMSAADSSALSAFGMLPASICNMPTDEMTASAMAMADRCRAEDETNPGVELGLFMARNTLRGRDKVTFVMSPSLERFRTLVGATIGRIDRQERGWIDTHSRRTEYCHPNHTATTVSSSASDSPDEETPFIP